MEVLSGNHTRMWAEVWAVVHLRLAPTVGIRIELSDVSTIHSGNLYNLGGLSTIRLPSGPEIEVRTVGVQLGETITSLVIPTRQPVTTTVTGLGLQSVRFEIVNYPGLFQHDRPAVLMEGPWRIEICPHRDFHAVKEALNAEGGYALTHEGFMRRSDGGTFSAEEAEPIIKGLHQFLSFARGGNCGITLIAGSDENEDLAWEQWGAYSTHPWFILSSWLDHRHNNNEELAQAFPGFMRVLTPGRYSVEDRVHVALYWYLRSNESNNPYSGIVLAHAALERLGIEVVSDTELSASEGNRRLDEALKKVGIGWQLPVSCKELTAMEKKNGPKALADARNELVHPDAREALSLDALVEIHNVGQWYAELLLLWKFGYQGRYANRLTYAFEGKWEQELVPWARLRQQD